MDQKTSFETVKPLEYPIYAKLDDISRCVHYDDFKVAVQRQLLVPQGLNNSRTVLPQKVLWFAPSQSSSEHNFYGNVSFTIKWKTVLQKLGPNLYLIDQAIYNTRSFTRVVLTKNNYDGILPRLNLDSSGSPMITSLLGFYHASQCMNRAGAVGPHELQIAIEVDDADARWLYRECCVAANNHSEANAPNFGDYTRRNGEESKFKSFKCFKFNTARNCVCFYKWTLEECEEHMKAVLGAAKPSTSSGHRATTRESCSLYDMDLHTATLPSTSRANMGQRTSTRSESNGGAIAVAAVAAVAAAATVFFAWRKASRDSK
ncbi:uncharacterized protein LOC108680417 isoform X1 [Hyalella azteca]|uniref:Uncharacterized protein LOC108680417 isoform X1 n=1 Tax=Hyalella azteca TaxID=294128 RepID=A0A8B7PGL6_HYAAZ|nr:uncharacterized protein LOC108680417 isoform X1 [Hyalella azteca]